MSRPRARRAFVATGIGVLAAALGIWSCRESPAPSPALRSPRLVLLYATCTLNKDYLSPYNPAVTSTPHLERFRRDALVFRRHHSEAGQTGTAFASIFSGSQAEHHGIFRHPTPLADDVGLIGETFRRGGWDVHAWLEHGMASGELGYAQGADDDQVHATLITADDPELATVLDRLRQDQHYRALILTSFTVTHGPYQLAAVDSFCRLYPGECGARADREAFARYADFYRRSHAFLSYDFPGTAERTALTAEHLANLVEVIELLYRANVGYLDHLFGAVVDEIRHRGLLADSIIVFTADHGETLFREGTHFKWTHGNQLAPEVLNVPLLIRAPGVGVRAGSWEPVTRSIDLYPTLAALAGLPPPPSGEGRGIDLAAALRGHEPAPTLPAYSHTGLIPEPVLKASRKWTLFRSLFPRIDPELMWTQVREEDMVYQLRRTLTGELEPAVFDLAADPFELRNLVDPADPRQDRAFRDLDRYRERLLLAYRERGEPETAIDLERQEELLRALGYIE
ncbi:MAG: sulfatase-like hydrolase/transferase [bacterium]|nr:sulfatase-like hydrolase/transferase [bacterium]